MAFSCLICIKFLCDFITVCFDNGKGECQTYNVGNCSSLKNIIPVNINHWEIRNILRCITWISISRAKISYSLIFPRFSTVNEAKHPILTNKQSYTSNGYITQWNAVVRALFAPHFADKSMLCSETSSNCSVRLQLDETRLECPAHPARPARCLCMCCW